MNTIPLSVQIFSLAGAFCCLLGYVGHQLKWMNPSKAFYNLLNFVGAAILAYLAFKPFQAGFFIMEFIWALISVLTLFKSLKKKQ